MYSLSAMKMAGGTLINTKEVHMEKQEQQEEQTPFLTKEDLVKYLRENLKLDIKSKPLRDGDHSVYTFFVGLKLEGQVIHHVSFNA